MATEGSQLEAWRGGDLSAGNSLFETHYRAVYRFFRGRVSGEVDDLVQSTFARCAASKEKLTEDGTFRSYVFAVARNVLREHYRATRREGLVVELGSMSVADLGVTPTGILAKRDEERLLLEALRTIPLDHQIAIELSYWEGLTAKELARVLDVPVGTAKTRLRTARKALEARLAQLAASPEMLESTLGDLQRWSSGLRDQF
ncbi:MAG: RNA polymerase sigma factor [Nannocystaceae bacterium]|nr:RNA polymerase sigma factor [Nannocystaceae bacterium]